MTILKQSPNQSFRVTQLAHSIAICEALNGDRFNWGNATDTSPAFLVYVGCRKDEVAEIKIRGMQRYSDSHAFGLDYLVESEEAKHFGCDYDDYNYYTTGYQPRW